MQLSYQLCVRFFICTFCAFIDIMSVEWCRFSFRVFHIWHDASSMFNLQSSVIKINNLICELSKGKWENQNKEKRVRAKKEKKASQSTVWIICIIHSNIYFKCIWFPKHQREITSVDEIEFMWFCHTSFPYSTAEPFSQIEYSHHIVICDLWYICSFSFSIYCFIHVIHFFFGLSIVKQFPKSKTTNNQCFISSFFPCILYRHHSILILF